MDDLRVNVLVSRFQNAFFAELAAAIVDEMHEIGVDARVVATVVEAEDRDVFVLLPTHEYVALEGRGHLSDPGLARRTIGLTAEQPGTSHFDTNVELAENLGAVFDFSPHAVQAYAHAGIAARHFQFGWTKGWDRFAYGGQLAGPEVVFMGSSTERRHRQLALLGRSLWQRDAQIIISDNSRPNHQASGTFLVGDDKRSLLASATLLINIHQTELPYFEWLRASEAMLCGAVVLTEPSIHMEPFVEDLHLVVRTAAAMPSAIDELLADEPRRRRIRQAAYDELRRHPLRRSVEDLLDIASTLSRPSAGPTHVVGPAKPMPFGDEGPVDGAHDRTKADVLRQAIREIRLDLIEVKRQLNAARSGRTDEPPTEVMRSAAEHLANGPPTVSVILALYNHALYVTEALDSVANVGYADLEVIVVNDGSTDDSLGVVRRWITTNPDTRIRLIDVPINRGLPRARNTAIEHARGDLCFVLDADNAIVPGGITALVEALAEAPDAAFAYGILQDFGAQGPLGLMGSYPWDPARLAGGNYIDAMSLIRRSVLTDLEGYTTDRRLYGWEDYDLWCRIAERGGGGVHVRRVVGRYRTALSSMVSLSNLSHDSAFDALREHAPRLMDGSLPTLVAAELDRR